MLTFVLTFIRKTAIPKRKVCLASTCGFERRKDIKLQKESVSSRSYRNIEAEGRSTETAPVLTTLAEAALAILARAGEQPNGGENPGDKTWRFATGITDGRNFEISCTGPDLPATVPADIAFPADIPKQPKWVGTYRLVVAAPLVAFDICWQVDVPLRIMTFSRGDWEEALITLAE